MNLSRLDMSILKGLYEERKITDEKIEKYLKQNIQKDFIVLCDLPIITSNISKAIKEVLDRNEKSWVDFMLRFTFQSFSPQEKVGSFPKNVFIFGEKSIIRKRLKEISENIFDLRELKGHCLWVGFDLKVKPDIQDLI